MRRRSTAATGPRPRRERLEVRWSCPVPSRRLVELDRDFRFDPSRRLLQASSSPAEQAYPRLARHFPFARPSGAVDAEAPHRHRRATRRHFPADCRLQPVLAIAAVWHSLGTLRQLVRRGAPRRRRDPMLIERSLGEDLLALGVAVVMQPWCRPARLNVCRTARWRSPAVRRPRAAQRARGRSPGPRRGGGRSRSRPKSWLGS